MVISSLVGPNPPVIKTKSDLKEALDNAFIISFLSSEITTPLVIERPKLFSCSPIQDALVLIVWPINNSSPMEITC